MGAEVLGKTWFAVEAKTFEISIEEKNKKLRGCIWERCKGATSWVRFGESSLQRLLLGIEDCDMISRKQEWFANWEEKGRSYKLERRSNKAGNFLYCSVRDAGWKRFGICIPKGRGLVRGWKIMAEKLRSLGVGPKRLERQKINVREEIKVPEKRLMDTPKSFAKAVIGTGIGLTEEVVRVRVGKNETVERLGQLESCLVGWWGGGTSPISDLKFLKHRAWQTWEVTGRLKVEELRRGLWLFGFESPNEARRILREGTGRLGGLPIFLREWGKDVGCKVGRERCRTVWIRLLGLPLHLWSHLILKRIGDKCGGFVAVDDNTTPLNDPRWARIRVKWDGSSNPRSVIVSEGDRSFAIQLWWELQPQMVWESRTSEPKKGSETREEGDVSPRAIERVGYSVQDRMKTSEKSNGILHREKGKFVAEERQTDGAWSREERKDKLVEEQTGWGGSVRGMGCRCRLGPTGMGQELRRVRGRKNGLGDFGGGEPSTIPAQAKGPELKQVGPLQLLGPADKKLSPVQRGMRDSPAKEQVIEEQRSCPSASDRTPMKQIRGATPFHNRKEGGRRDDQVVASLPKNEDSRYVRSTHEDSPSSMISGGSSGQEGSLKLKKIEDLEPLRMVTVDGREWGLESSDALEVIIEGSGGEGQQGEESASVDSEALGYEKWEDSCLIKFSEFMGFSTVGFESEILGLLRKIVARQHQVENKGAGTKSRCERELKKLVCTINYDERSQIKGGDKERGSLMLRS